MPRDSTPPAPAPWSLEKLEQAIAQARAAVVDVETEGLDWRRHKICGWVWNFGPSPDDCTYLPVRHKGAPVANGRNLDAKKTAAAIKSGLKKNPRLRTIGHNLHFDLKFMAAEGIDISRTEEPYEDTQINGFLINELQRSFSLDAQCRFMGVTEKKGEELYAHLAAQFGGAPTREQMGNYHRLAPDDPIGVDYALGDGISTWALCEAQQAKLDENGLRQIWMIERRCIRALARMSVRGIAVDEQRLKQVMSLVQKQIDKYKSMLPKDFNPRSPIAMKELLAANGVTGGWPLTPGGRPSYPKSWLLTLPIGRAIVQTREFEHLMNSFLIPMHGRHLFNGRVHTTYNQTRGEEFGTITGRLSSSDPNLQQVHKRNMLLGPIFRSIYVPDRGKIMATADYEQIEPRLLAHYAEIKMLVNGFLSDPPIDAHSMVAINAFGYDPKDKSNENKDKRQRGKTLNQALITGSGDRAAIAQLGVDVATGAQIIAAYFGSMPELKPAQKKISNQFIRDGYLTSLLGRRAHLDDMRFAYRGMNRLLQCGNADILKKSMCDIDEYLYTETRDEVSLLNNIHDDLQYQFDAKDERYFKRSLELMCDYGPDGQSVSLDVPLTVDAKTGKDWGEATYGVDAVKSAFKELGGKYER